MDRGKDTDGTRTRASTCVKWIQNIFSIKKCSHAVGKAQSYPIAKTNFANCLKGAGSSFVYLPFLN